MLNITFQYKCCGVDAPKDWIGIVSTETEKNLPMSCCKPEIGIIGTKECKLDQTTKVYQTGCAVEFGNFVREHAVSLGASGIILAFIQVSHFFFTLTTF